MDLEVGSGLRVGRVRISHTRYVVSVFGTLMCYTVLTADLYGGLSNGRIEYNKTHVRIMIVNIDTSII